jgi:dynein assembly factor with WDR repeat domains 1
VITDKKEQEFDLFQVLPCHKLPLTNCAFNKNGDKFITGSYDHTCIIWDTDTGNLVNKLVGHKSVVYAISFNLPYGDKVGTASFDATAKV